MASLWPLFGIKLSGLLEKKNLDKRIWKAYSQYDYQYNTLTSQSFSLDVSVKYIVRVDIIILLAIT